MAKSDVLVRMKADTQNYDANIAKARRQLDQFKKDNLSMGGVLKQLSGSLVGAAAGFASITAAVGAATAAISSNIETAKNFEKSMSQLSSLTGKVGEDLNKLKEYAIDLGGSTTLTASQVADAFKMIGSQQPQLLSSSEALKAVTKNAITLAEAAGIDLATAAQTLSTSINQMGGDSANAGRYINVLAAASQKGAGDISWLGEAITKSATAAKAVGTDYEELVANLEQLAKAGFDASTAGTALRSIIMNLEKQANQDFKPSIVGLTQAFENLGKANLTITQYQEIAGKMFASQAMALANAAGEAKHMREEITGTNTAEEQAETNTDNLDGSLKSLSSAWEALNLHINSSNGLLKSAVDWLKDVVKWADQAFTAAGRAQKKLAELQGGGNGQPTKVDRQISALRGSNFKDQRYNADLERYNRQIMKADELLKKYDHNRASRKDQWPVMKETEKFFGKMYTRDELDTFQKALMTMRDEYMSRVKQILNPGSGGGSNSNQTITIDADTDNATKSIKELQAEIKKLKKLRDDAADEGNFEMRDKYNADIKSIQAQIKTMRGGGSDTTKKDLDELQKVQKQIADLTKEAYTADESRQEQIRKEIAGLQEQEKKLISIKELVTGTAKGPDLDKLFPDMSKANFNTGYAGSAQAKYDSARADLALGPMNLDAVNDYIGSIKGMMKDADLGSELYNNMTEKLKDATTVSTLLQEMMERGLAGADLESTAQALKEKLLSPEGIDQTAIQSFLEELNKQIEEAGGVGLKLNADTGEVTDDNDKDKGNGLKELFGKFKEFASGLNQVASGLQQMGIKLPKGVNDVLGVVNGVISVIQGVSTIIGVFQTSAITSNTIALGALTSAVTANTFAKFIPFFAGGGVVPAFAQGGTIPKFADGGLIGRAALGMMIPGNSMSGDNLRLPVDGGLGMIGVNSGEVILNRAQQGVLASALEDNSQVGYNSQPYLDGELIYLGLQAYMRRSGKGEIVTANR